MARAQAVWRKSGRRISVTARLLLAPYLAQRSPPKSKSAISPKSSSSPSLIRSHGWILRTGKEEELSNNSDKELGGGFRRHPFSFFADPCSGGKNSETLAVVDVSLDVLDLLRTCLD
jgi:hypothetical protein